jgi:hypothetical protein
MKLFVKQFLMKYHPSGIASFFSINLQNMLAVEAQDDNTVCEDSLMVAVRV